jgi:hypothetical protein
VNVRTPIHIDPLLGEVFELLYRMQECRTREPFVWMASDAIRKLGKYEEQQKLNRGSE